MMRQAFVLLALLLAGAPAQALCLAPLCQCTVASTGPAFGSVMPLSALATDSSGSVRVQCGGVAGLLIPFRVDLGAGGGTVGARRLAGPGGTLAYNLYRDAARSSVWGSDAQGVNGSVLLDVLGWSPEQVLTIYGRIPGGQTGVVPGLYTDTIAVTLTFY